ncbi:MAG: HypC/HybG/HupF family hydrogenase formation chaperone [Candidatus Omnitrophica bacterium]|nr:HypC/HybG/HupF family hydrogenase formation chaperone [Candidatus Omnitrophota bacterium]MDD5487718.1 HypC/HybG/HupF family hydrogenase formation chaperone [Candidatus Omnitrophota bacterium]
MCLAVPGRIREITGSDPFSRMGMVDFGGVLREVNMAYVPEASEGDYVIVHAGFALNTVDADEAEGLIRDIGELRPEGGDDEIR